MNAPCHAKADAAWKQAYAEISKIPLRQIEGDLYKAVQIRAAEIRLADKAKRAIFAHLKAKGNIAADETFESFMSADEEDKEAFKEFNELIEVIIKAVT